MKSPHRPFTFEIVAKTGVMHAVPASKNRVSVQPYDLEFIHDYVKPHASFVHLLGLKKFIMYLYSIYIFFF